MELIVLKDRTGEFDSQVIKKYQSDTTKSEDKVLSLLAYPAKICKLIYTTNPIEMFNPCLRKVAQNKSTFPREKALCKNLFLHIRKQQFGKLHQFSGIDPY